MNLPLRPAALAYLACDIALVAVSWAISRALFALGPSTEGTGIPDGTALALMGTAFIIPFLAGRVYGVLWSHSYVRDVYRLLGACAAGTVLFIAGLYATGVPAHPSLPVRRGADDAHARRLDRAHARVAREAAVRSPRVGLRAARRPLGQAADRKSVV